MSSSLLKLYERAKRQSRGALCLFVEDGLATAYYHDAADLAKALGLVVYVSSNRISLGVRQASFPVVVLTRNLRTLKGLGVRVVVHGEIVAKCRRCDGRPVGVDGEDTSKYKPTIEQIEAAAAEVGRAWSEGERMRRAGGSGVVPVSFSEISEADIYG